jgi:hypothetical protein
MKITTTLALAAGLAALSACNQSTDEAANNIDANLEMPAENLDTMDANATNDADAANLGNDANAAADTGNADATADNTASNAY